MSEPRYTVQSPPGLATLRAWYRSQKRLNPENKKKYEKIQNPAPRIGPRKYEKKILKKYKLAQNCHFCIYSVFFSYFRGPIRGAGFCFFFVIFSYFRDSGVFVICTRPAGSQSWMCLSWAIKLSGPLRLRLQSRSRTRLRIAASIAFSFRACFKGV